jgi:hypothetical protein
LGMVLRRRSRASRSGPHGPPVPTRLAEADRRSSAPWPRPPCRSRASESAGSTSATRIASAAPSSRWDGSEADGGVEPGSASEACASAPARR